MNKPSSGPPTSEQKEIQHLPFTTDAGAGARARIGVLVLQSDHTVEDELRLLAGMEGVAVYHARLSNSAVVTPDTLAQMEHELPVAAGLLPQELGLKSIGYGCTSGTTMIGQDRVKQILNEIHPGVPSTDPLTAAKAAMSALGMRRIGLLTPYTRDVTAAMEGNFRADGLDVSVVGSFYEDSDHVVGRIDPQSILDATLSIGRQSNCDGVFISCTSLRAAGIIEQAEAALGKPVTSSNHALAWHLLRLAGIEDACERFGRLFKVSKLDIG